MNEVNLSASKAFKEPWKIEFFEWLKKILIDICRSECTQNPPKTRRKTDTNPIIVSIHFASDFKFLAREN